MPISVGLPFLVLSAAYRRHGVAGPVARSVARPPHASGEPEGTFVLARVSNNPRKDYPALKPLGDYLAPRLPGAGINEARSGSPAAPSR